MPRTAEVTKVERWVPDYTCECSVCGQKPVVTGVKNDTVVYQGDMCGVCTWGEAAMLDPEAWNE